MNRKYILLLIAMLFLGMTPGSAFGQKKQQQKMIRFESVVVDDNGIPIPNVLVSAKEGSIEALTGPEGKFSIEVPEESKLLIEAKGYEDLIIPSIPVLNKLTLKKVDFLMDPSNSVNIAFGKVKEREVVGALSVVNTKDFIKYDNSQYLYDAIRARVPGLLGDSNIRGIGEAVFVVDGFPREISNLNIEEIDQITVLKDANSAILWGGQAKNGVVMITTKRGQAYKRKINVSAEQGFSTPISLPKYLGSQQYLTLYNEALTNDGLPAAIPNDSIAKYYGEGSNPYLHPSVDYYSSDFLRKSKSFSKILTEFSGGNEATQYYGNVGWIHGGSLYALGTGKSASTDRFNIRGNVDFRVNNFINSFVDALIIIDSDKGPRGDFWGMASNLHPDYFPLLLPVSMVKSNFTRKGGANLQTAEIVNDGYILGGTSQYTNNVYGNMLFAGYMQNIRRTGRFNAGVNVDLKAITTGLKLKTYISLDVYNAYIQTVTNSYAVYQPTWNSYGTHDSITVLNKIGTDVSTGVQNLGDGGFFRRLGTYAMLDYARTKDNHSFAGTLLGYFDTYSMTGLTIDRKNSHLGLRLTYDYSKKFFVDFSSAYVNGFKLKKGNKGGLSPSLGVAVVLRDQQSKQDLGEFNYLKLRASAGIINYEWEGTNYRLYENTLSQGSNFSWADQSGRTMRIAQTLISRADNPNLSFQKMKNVNLGMEGYFFNNLVYLDANVFAYRNSGLVVQRTIYGSYIGNNIPYENYNATDYKGGELGITISKSIGEFYIDLGANFLYSTSNVVKKDELWSNSYQYRQGKPNDAIFGLQSLGLFQNQADIDASPVQKFGEVKPGDIKYKDQNGDGKIDADDEVQIGNYQPKFYYGLHFTIRYKAFSLFAIGNGINGAESFYSNSYFWNQGNGKYSEMVLNRWTPSTGATATYPRLSSKNSPNNFRNSTYWLYANNYFNLDRVQLNFDLPKFLIRKISSREMTVYLRGENLARISKDASRRQLHIGGEPPYTSYALGLRILF